MNVCINDTFRLKKVLTCLKWSEMISKDIKKYLRKQSLAPGVCVHVLLYALHINSTSEIT